MVSYLEVLFLIMFVAMWATIGEYVIGRTPESLALKVVAFVLTPILAVGAVLVVAFERVHTWRLDRKLRND